MGQQVANCFLIPNLYGTVEVTNTLDRFVIGKATKPSEDGKVYMKIIN